MEIKKIEKVVCILSGGMDSTTLLYYLKDINDVYVLSFDYGQRHKKELEYAQKTTQKLGLNHKIINLNSINELLKGSALTDNIAVPEGHYEDESMKLTVVPNRNMIMLAIATGYAVSIGATKVFCGVHSGDHAIYPDCRPEFIDKLSEVTKIANYIPVVIEAPFRNLTKKEIAVIGKELNVPYEDSWTCYKGLEKPCGKCGACQERIEAMKFADIKDIQYE